MKLNKLLIFGLLFLIGLPSISQKVFNDANATKRNVGSFNAIVVSSAVDVFISQSPSIAVAVSAADARYLDRIVTEVKNNTLYIYIQNNGNDWGTKDVRAYISMPALNRIVASGACDVKVEGKLQATDLEIELSGSCDFKGDVTVQNLKLNASGSSDFMISGNTSNLHINVSGASDIKAFGLESKYCDVVASGASDINITVQKELKIQASGASDVSYKGNATIKEIKSTGASNVNKKD